MTMMYCAYCGRVRHRCECGTSDSRLQQFLRRPAAANVYHERLRDRSYTRGVPPQVKRQARARLNSHRDKWYAVLSQTHGHCCANCAATDALVLDHVIPVAKGGKSELDNLQLLCATCNRLKGKLVIDCRPADNKSEGHNK